MSWIIDQWKMNEMSQLDELIIKDMDMDELCSLKLTLKLATPNELHTHRTIMTSLFQMRLAHVERVIKARRHHHPRRHR